MADVNITIAGRSYRIACRDGEEDNLLTAAGLVDQKSREALAGLGSLSEARQLLFAALLLADQLIDKGETVSAAVDDSGHASAVHALADRLEQLADLAEASGSAG